jgi:hypothetical protein
VTSQMAQTFGIKAPPITNDTVNFWKDYREFVAKVRNTLFGQTLTKAEERSFDQFTINPTTSAENARTYFDRQIQILNDAANRQRRIGRSIGVNDQTLNAYLGEEMPGQAQPQPQPQPQPQSQQQQAIAAFGSYEPDKYEYGTNPATGKFARRPRSQ